jgi:hypothetical protein
MGHFKGPRPRYWEEWEAFSKTSKRAVIVYHHNRCLWAARTRDREGSWAYETLWYYLKGVQYTVSIRWYEVRVTTGKATQESPLVYHPVDTIPAHVMKVVRKVQSVLSEKITEADRARLAELEAFKDRMLAGSQKVGEI